VLLRAALIACLLASAVGGCAGDGGDDSADEAPVVESSLRELVVAELKSAGLEAEPGIDLNVVAFEGPNRVDLALDDAFAQYEADPDRKEEIVAGLVEEVQQRLEEGVSERSLDDVRADLMPLLQGTFDLRTYGFQPAEGEFPGNASVVYVVDAEDSYTVVRPEDVERWGTSVEELHEIAVDNLLRMTNEEEELLCEPSGNRELCGWSTSDGYDATRMIVPGLRRQIVREYGGPAAYAAPMENVFVALPLDLLERGRTEELFRTKVQRDFETSDNPFSPEVYVERDGELVLWK
jgi:uncharacterized protein YtpQ (UPF0354 family)